MDLTEENKRYIDSLSYEQLLIHWRKAPEDDSWFLGDTGLYWFKRMKYWQELPGGLGRRWHQTTATRW